MYGLFNVCTCSHHGIGGCVGVRGGWIGEATLELKTSKMTLTNNVALCLNLNKFYGL